MSICGISFSEINDFLIHSVAIQGQSVTPDGAGGETTGWSTSSTVAGLVSSLNGRELYEMEKIDPEINGKVILIKDAVVTSENRLLINSIHYDVKFVKDPVSADEFIVCYTKSENR